MRVQPLTMFLSHVSLKRLTMDLSAFYCYFVGRQLYQNGLPLYLFRFLKKQRVKIQIIDAKYKLAEKKMVICRPLHKKISDETCVGHIYKKIINLNIFICWGLEKLVCRKQNPSMVASRYYIGKYQNFRFENINYINKENDQVCS